MLSTQSLIRRKNKGKTWARVCVSQYSKLPGVCGVSWSWIDPWKDLEMGFRGLWTLEIVSGTGCLSFMCLLFPCLKDSLPNFHVNGPPPYFFQVSLNCHLFDMSTCPENHYLKFIAPWSPDSEISQSLSILLFPSHLSPFDIWHGLSFSLFLS